MKKVLILMGRYLPGYKDGGPLRTIINVTDALGDEYDFYIACLDRDHGDREAYPNILRNEWNLIGKAKVWYVAPGGFTTELLIKLASQVDMVYCCSFYDDYGYKTLLLKKQRKITCPVVVASMGVFSKGALSHKALKKKVFINGCKMMGLFKGITWSVTSELEAEDAKREIGKNIKYIIAEDLPRTSVPGRIKKHDKLLKVCFLSRICEHKGLDIVIEALSRIENKNIEFSIFGPIQDQNYWNTCLKKLEHLNLLWTYKGDVQSEDVQNVLSTQDVLILPTKSENYGHVIFEALSVGCIPIISYKTPWNIVKTKCAGYVVSRTIESFELALLEYMNLSDKEKNKIIDEAIKFAKDKVKQSKENTGYRDIFELRGNK